MAVLIGFACLFTFFSVLFYMCVSRDEIEHPARHLLKDFSLIEKIMWYWGRVVFYIFLISIIITISGGLGRFILEVLK